MKRSLLLLAVVALAWSCDNKNENNAPSVQYAVLDFESASIAAGPTSAGENLYSAASFSPWGPGIDGYDPAYPNYTSYTDADTGLTVGLNVDEGESWSTGNPEFSAGGIAPSRWNDMEGASYLNQCSVYFDQDCKGGRAGSETFGIVYAPVDLDGTPRPAVMSFAEGVERTIESMWITNSTYAALSGVGEFVLVVEGFDAGGTSTGKSEFELTGVRRWVQVPLSKLGKINRLELTVDCPAAMAPTYVCIDDVKVIL